MSKFPFVLALLLAASASAQDAPVTLGLHVASVHSAPGYCNFNPGGYARWANGLTVGAYRNSNCAPSMYIGGTWGLEYGRIELAATVGVITGYKRGPLPMLIPSVAFAVTKDVAVRLAFIPRVEKGMASAVHLMVELRR